MSKTNNLWNRLKVIHLSLRMFSWLSLSRLMNDWWTYSASYSEVLSTIFKIIISFYTLCSNIYASPDKIKPNYLTPLLFLCYCVITIPLVFRLPLEIELFQYCHQFCIWSLSNHTRIQYFNIPISASTSIAAFSTVLEELWVISPKRVTHLGITIFSKRCFPLVFFWISLLFWIIPKQNYVFK